MIRIVDIVIIFILAFFFISGLKRGLIRQVLDIVGIVAAFIGAFYFAHYLATYFESSLRLPYRMALVVSALVIFISILILFHLIGLLFKKVASITLMGPFDRIGGAIFGAFKGVLLVSLILVILFNIPLPHDFKEELRADPLATALYPVLPMLFNLIMSHSPARLNFERIVRSEGKRQAALQEGIEEVERSGEASEKEIGKTT